MGKKELASRAHGKREEPMSKQPQRHQVTWKKGHVAKTKAGRKQAGLANPSIAFHSL